MAKSGTKKPWIREGWSQLDFPCFGSLRKRTKRRGKGGGSCGDKVVGGAGGK